MNPSHTDDLLLFNKLTIIEQVNTLKAELDNLRPINKEQEERIMQKFQLDWTYHSNAIEGNPLNYGETVAFLMYGITAKGKLLKDHFDIRGHNEAINYLLDLIKSKEQNLSESDIRALHKMLLVEPFDNPAQTAEGLIVQKRIKLGQYKTTPNHVKTITGQTHYYATPEDTPILMGELIEWYRAVQSASIMHPVVIAAVFHHRFASIHPFDDGNGRMSRLLMNLILMQYEYPPVVIKNDRKNEYCLALSQADTGDIGTFIEHIGEYMIHSLNLYIKGAKGESIEESTDLDKKLILFKKELYARKDRVEVTRSYDTKLHIAENSLKPLLVKYEIMLSKFKDLFLEYQDYLLFFKPLITSTIHYGDRWHYEPANLDSFKSDYKNYFLKNNALFISSSFMKFVLETNPFSLEVKLVLIFEELEYRIFYTIARAKEIENLTILGYDQWLGVPALRKYYHQIVTEDEIDKLMVKIGDALFEDIQKIVDDPKRNDLEISEKDIDFHWIEFVAEENLLDFEELKDSISGIKIKGNIITIELRLKSPKSNDEKLNLENRFSNYLSKNGLVKNRVLVEIV